MTIHYSPSAKISLPIPAVGYSEFNVTQYSSVLENLSSETYMYQEVWLTQEEAKARGTICFHAQRAFSVNAELTTNARAGAPGRIAFISQNATTSSWTERI